MVRTHLSVHGTVMGVAAFPQCNPKSELCRTVDKLLSALAYKPFVQKHLFQAGYYRDPTLVGSDEYRANSQIARWNGEGPGDIATYKANFGKTQQFVMVRALGDTMIWPSEGEWW